MSVRILTAELAAWSRECLAAGDDEAEVAADCGLSVEQLLCALGIRRPLTACQREVVSLYAAGSTFDAIDRELWGTPHTRGRVSSSMLPPIRRKGYDVPMRGHTRRGAGA